MSARECSTLRPPAASYPLRFPQVTDPSAQLAGAVTERIWPCVMLQWEWLGGIPPLRRAAIVGAGSWGTALAHVLARAGVDVQLGCRTREQADAYAHELGLSFPLLLDADSKVMHQYRVFGLPTTVVVGRDGVIREVTVGEMSPGSLGALLAKALH